MGNRRLSPVPQIALACVVILWGLYTFNPSAGLSSDFFFGENDPAVQEAREIGRLFPSGEQLVLVVRSPYVNTSAYQTRVELLAEEIEKSPAVRGVLSLGHGPADFADAMESPLWRRLIIGGQRDNGDVVATHVIALLTPGDSQSVVRHARQVAEVFGGEGFTIEITGTPAILDQVATRLKTDLVVFASACLAVFSLLVMLFFRSLVVAAGTLVAGLGAVMGTLALASTLNAHPGPLVGGLGIMVYVMALSHSVFLAANLRRPDSDGLWGATFRASLLCAFTTACGFASLVFVPAAPLQQLGVSGMMGTVIAWLFAYAVMPGFVEAKGRIADNNRNSRSAMPPARIAWMLLLALMVTGLGASRLNTAPSLLEYFDTRSVPYQALSYLNENGGSAPLRLIIEDRSGSPFDTPEVLQRLGRLQQSLDEASHTGSAISLPVLLAEANRNPVAALLSDAFLIDILSSSLFDSVAKQFLSDDRKRTLVMLRMREDSSTSRSENLNSIRQQVTEHGFVIHAMAGLYTLQLALGDVLRTSIWQGCALLIFLFATGALLLGRSFRLTAALFICLSAIPLSMYGWAGILRLPIDLFVAPAGAIAMGLAVDSLVHITVAAKSADSPLSRSAWEHALATQRRPITLCLALVALGFALFALSGFPPTRRLGLVAVFGMLAAGIIALFVLPAIAAPSNRRAILHE